MLLRRSFSSQARPGVSRQRHRLSHQHPTTATMWGILEYGSSRFRGSWGFLEGRFFGEWPGSHDRPEFRTPIGEGAALLRRQAWSPCTLRPLGLEGVDRRRLDMSGIPERRRTKKKARSFIRGASIDYRYSVSKTSQTKRCLRNGCTARGSGKTYAAETGAITVLQY